jgi:hypothetical protein
MAVGGGGCLDGVRHRDLEHDLFTHGVALVRKSGVNRIAAGVFDSYGQARSYVALV